MLWGYINYTPELQKQALGFDVHLSNSSKRVVRRTWGCPHAGIGARFRRAGLLS